METSTSCGRVLPSLERGNRLVQPGRLLQHNVIGCAHSSDHPHRRPCNDPPGKPLLRCSSPPPPPPPPAPPFVDSAAKRNDASTTDASTIVPPHLPQTHDREAVSSTVPPETHVLETSPEVSVFETANADAASRADQKTPTSALQQPLQPEDTVAVTAEHQSQPAETTEAAEQQPQSTVEAEATLDQRPTAGDPVTAEGNQDQLQEETPASAGRHPQPVPAARATDQQPAAETVTTEQPSTRGNPETPPEADPTYAEVLRSPRIQTPHQLTVHQSTTTTQPVLTQAGHSQRRTPRGIPHCRHGVHAPRQLTLRAARGVGQRHGNHAANPRQVHSLLVNPVCILCGS